MNLKRRKKNNPPYTAKLTIMTYRTLLSRFKSTARRLGCTYADLMAEALKDIVKKYK